MRDIVSKWGTLRNGLTMPAKSTTGTVYGTAYDVSEYNGCVFYILGGSYTDGTHTFTFLEADDDTGNAGSAPANGDAQWTAIDDSRLVAWKATSTTDYTPTKISTTNGALAGITATPANYRVGYMGGKKWVQVKLVVATGATGCAFNVIVGLGEPRNMPAAV